MNDVDRAIVDTLNAGGFAAYFGVAPDGVPCPLVVVDVLRDQQLTALRRVGGNNVTVYQLRAVTSPEDDTAGTVVTNAAAYLAANSPSGVVIVPTAGTDRRRFVDPDGFYNAVTALTAYSEWSY